MSVRFWPAVSLLVVTLSSACLETVYDIQTDEFLVRVPASRKDNVTIDSGRIELPTKLGTDKTVDSSTLQLIAANLNPENSVVVDISGASSLNPNVFDPIATGIHLEPGEARAIKVVQTEPDDVLVTATQSDWVNIRFHSSSPQPGIGEIEFLFTIRVLAHKETPGTGPGTLIFY